MSPFEARHVAKLHLMPCCVSGLRPAAVHHIDTQHRRVDLLTIPLHHLYHQGLLGIHTLGSKAWQERFGFEAELLTKTWAQMDAEYVATVKALLNADRSIRRRCETHGGQRLREILKEG